MTQPTPHTNPPVPPTQTASSGLGNITQAGRDINNSNNRSFLILSLTMMVLGGMVGLGVVFGRGIGTQVNQPQLSAPIAPAAPASSSSKP
jgi:hypothetical protein